MVGVGKSVPTILSSLPGISIPVIDIIQYSHLMIKRYGLPQISLSTVLTR